MQNYISFNGYFRPPINSHSGQFLLELKENNIHFHRAFRAQGGDLKTRYARIMYRTILASKLSTKIFSDILLWGKHTFTKVPQKIGMKNHLANLVSFVALQILVIAIPFGYLPDVDPFRPLNGSPKDINLRLKHAYNSGNLEILPTLIREGLEPEKAFETIIKRISLDVFIYEHYVNLIQFILKLGVDPNRGAFDKTSWQILMESWIQSKSRGPIFDIVFIRLIKIFKLLIRADAHFNGENALNHFKLSQLLELAPIVISLEAAATPEDRRRILNSNKLENNPFYLYLDDRVTTILAFKELISLIPKFEAVLNEAQKEARKLRGKIIDDAIPGFFIPHLANIIGEYWNEPVLE